MGFKLYKKKKRNIGEKTPVAIIEYIKKNHKDMTRGAIAKATGLSHPTITRYIKEILEEEEKLNPTKPPEPPMSIDGSSVKEMKIPGVKTPMDRVPLKTGDGPVNFLTDEMGEALNDLVGKSLPSKKEKPYPAEHNNPLRSKEERKKLAKKGRKKKSF